MQTLTFTQVTPEELAAMVAEMVRRELAGMQPAALDDEPMNVKEAAQFLNITVPTLYTIVKNLPHNKRGKRLYFFKSELTAYLKGGRRKTNQERREEVEQEVNRYMGKKRRVS